MESTNAITGIRNFSPKHQKLKLSLLVKFSVYFGKKIISVNWNNARFSA